MDCDSENICLMHRHCKDARRLTKARWAIYTLRIRRQTQWAPFVFVLLVAATAAAQDFRYEFHDTPSPEADVVVARYTLRQGPGADLYLVGRVFNRGLKPAKNIRVVYTLSDPNGAQYPTNPIYLNPPDLPPTNFANFEGKILARVDPRDVYVQVRAEWDP
jgi:hypothetical protein